MLKKYIMLVFYMYLTSFLAKLNEIYITEIFKKIYNFYVD